MEELCYFILSGVRKFWAVPQRQNKSSAEWRLLILMSHKQVNKVKKPMATEVVSEPSLLSGVQQRRALLDSKLSNYKQEKLKRKGFTTCRLCKRRHRSKEASFG